MYIVKFNKAEDIAFEVNHFTLANSHVEDADVVTRGQLYINMLREANNVDSLLKYASTPIDNVSIYDEEGDLIYTSEYWNLIQHVGVDYSPELKKMSVNFIVIHYEEKNIENEE